MGKKFIRKDKIVLSQNGNDDNVIAVSILIESNHVNIQFDNLLDLLSSNVKSSLMNYNTKTDKPKEKPQKKKKEFMDGVFV
jgi:hypothetical protein